MSHASSEETTGPPDRDESLARIRAVAARLRAAQVRPPDAYAFTEQVEQRFWAIGENARRVVRTPVEFGWAVGDYPWEGLVMRGHQTFGSEVFVRATFVDADGRIVPENPSRPAVRDNDLLTAQMCAEIAARMDAIAARAPGASPGPVP